MTKQSTINISLSREHADQIENVREVFRDFDTDISAEHMRLSAEDLAMQITIYLGGAFLSGAAWDLFKMSIKSLRTKYPKAGIAVRGEEPILFHIKPDQTINVMVVPDRVKEFEHVKTLNDLIKHLKKSNRAWQEVKIGDCATISRGGSPRPIKEYITTDPAGLNWLRIGDIDKDGKYIDKTAEKIKREGQNMTTIVHEGDLILSNSMSFGRPYISRITTCIHDGWLAFKNLSNEVERDFLYYLLLSEKIQNNFKNISAGSGVQNLKKETVQNIQISLPPLLEQKRIVAVLETWDMAIESIEKKIELKEQIKKGLMQQLLTGKKRLPGFGGEWRTIAFGDVGIFFKGKGISKKELVKEGVAAIRYGELYSKHNIKIKTIHSYISEEMTLSLVQIEKGDILFAGSGETIDEIGKSAVYQSEDDCYVGGDTIIVRPREDNSLFLSYLLNSNYTRRFLQRLGQGQSVVHLYKKDLQSLFISIPERKEQDSIVNILEVTDGQVTFLEKKLDALKQQKKFLLNNLITGKIRTPEDMKIV